MTDISVSRHHSSITLKNGDFYIEDKGSKFGTLILLRTEIAPLPKKALSIHSGQYWLNFYMDTSFWADCCCYS